jgi:hypothetical protein
VPLAPFGIFFSKKDENKKYNKNNKNEVSMKVPFRFYKSKKKNDM